LGLEFDIGAIDIPVAPNLISLMFLGQISMKSEAQRCQTSWGRPVCATKALTLVPQNHNGNHESNDDYYRWLQKKLVDLDFEHVLVATKSPSKSLTS